MADNPFSRYQARRDAFDHLPQLRVIGPRKINEAFWVLGTTDQYARGNEVRDEPYQSLWARGLTVEMISALRDDRPARTK